MSDEPRGPLASPGFWLHHAALTWRRAVESRLDGITYPQFNVLSAVSWLTAQHGPPTQQEAADFARSDRMMTSKLVRVLVAEGYLRRNADPSDARIRRLVLSARGRATVRSAIAAAHAVDEELLGNDRSTLRAHLREIAEHGWSASPPAQPTLAERRA